MPLLYLITDPYSRKIMGSLHVYRQFIHEYAKKLHVYQLTGKCIYKSTTFIFSKKKTLKFYLMQMKFYFLHVLVMGMFLSLHSFSQSVTLSYKTGLPDNGCNLFNVNNLITISGIQHYPVAGGVFFYHGDSAISLRCQAGYTISTQLGTAYALKYPFKEGYTYNIKAQSWQITHPSTGQNYLSFSMLDQLPDPNKTKPDACTAVDQDKWIDLTTTVLNTIALDTNKTNRDVGTFLMNQNHNYLTLVGWMNPSGTLLSSACLIRQLTVTETPPTYRLAPTNISKVCGTALSQTFTITDVYNSGKVNSYEWDLGADNNGWLYNGAPAPRIITTTSPSLPLTADACAVMTSNIVVRVTRPNGIFTSNTTVVTTTNPVTVSGPSQTCGGASTFTVSNLTCGDVTWSLSPGAIGTLSNTTGPTTTLTTPAQNQRLTVYANIATTCLPKTLSQPVSVITKPTNPGIYGEINCVDGRIVVPSNLYASSQNADSYFWSWRSPSGSNGTFSDHSDAVVKKFTLGSWTVYCYATNACGISETDEYPFTVKQCGGFAAASEREDVSVVVSPNPASNVVVITANTTNSAIQVPEKLDIREVRILDKTGRLLRKQSFPAGTTRATINVESFKSDIYILQIGDGKTFKTRKINISR